jgi:hypothetical protein
MLKTGGTRTCLLELSITALQYGAARVVFLRGSLAWEPALYATCHEL